MKWIAPAVGALLLSLSGGVVAHHLLTSGDGRAGFAVLCGSAVISVIFAARSVWLVLQKKHGGFAARIIAGFCYIATALLFMDFGRLPDFMPEIRVVAVSAACGFAAVGIAVVMLGIGKSRANQAADRMPLSAPRKFGRQ